MHSISPQYSHVLFQYLPVDTSGVKTRLKCKMRAPSSAVGFKLARSSMQSECVTNENNVVLLEATEPQVGVLFYFQHHKIKSSRNLWNLCTLTHLTLFCRVRVLSLFNLFVSCISLNPISLLLFVVTDSKKILFHLFANPRVGSIHWYDNAQTPLVIYYRQHELGVLLRRGLTPPRKNQPPFS